MIDYSDILDRNNFAKNFFAERLEFLQSVENTELYQKVRASLLCLVFFEEYRTTSTYIWKNGDCTEKETHYSNFLWEKIRNWKY